MAIASRSPQGDLCASIGKLSVKVQKLLNVQRRRRKFRTRRVLRQVSARPRVSVFRSTKHIYAQVIDDLSGRTLAQASTLDKALRGQIKFGGNVEAAKIVGAELARRALAAGVTLVKFDRREYKFHGRVAALANAAREAGLQF